MKAIIGSWDHRPYQLLAEATALRARVQELEARLGEVQEENATLREALHANDLEVVLSGA
jgi:prefoldin subunit 5